MQTQNGMNHAHNYDIIVKWLAEALRGETLDVLGIKSGRIQEVFAFEPVDIAVQAGRVDVMLRDDAGALYHLEEQRNLAESDLYRFAAYYFLGAKQWGRKLTDYPGVRPCFCRKEGSFAPQRTLCADDH